MAKLLEDVKDALNTRFNEKTGRYYVKGKLAHKESEVFGGRDLQDDPSLTTNHMARDKGHHDGYDGMREAIKTNKPMG